MAILQNHIYNCVHKGVQPISYGHTYYSKCNLSLHLILLFRTVSRLPCKIYILNN